jgi:hypothetical protein
VCVEIHPSARKHGIDDADIRHAIEFALAGAPIEGRPGERRLVVGPARTGNLPLPLSPLAGPMEAKMTDAPRLTVDGVPVTDAMVRAWADEAERGYDVETLLRNAEDIAVMPLSLDPVVRRALEQRAKSDETTPSVLIDRALRAYLNVA